MKSNKNCQKQCTDKHIDCEKQSTTNLSTNGQSRPKNKPVIYQTSPEGLVTPKTERAPYYLTPSKGSGPAINQAEREQPNPKDKPVIYIILPNGFVVPKVDWAPYYLTIPGKDTPDCS